MGTIDILGHCTTNIEAEWVNDGVFNVNTEGAFHLGGNGINNGNALNLSAAAGGIVNIVGSLDNTDGTVVLDGGTGQNTIQTNAPFRVAAVRIPV